MRLPSIRSSGTPAHELFNRAANALAALRVAYDALAQTAPNANDYISQPLGKLAAIDEAEAEHGARLLALAGLISDMEKFAEHATRAVDAQKKVEPLRAAVPTPGHSWWRRLTGG